METKTQLSKVKVIKITRGEGPIKLCGKEFEFKNWYDAHCHMLCQPNLPTFGYDKFDFYVEWENGETYRGRLDAKHKTKENNDLNPRKHVYDYLMFYNGRKPYWMDEERYKLCLESRKETCKIAKHLLETCDCGQILPKELI